MRQKLEISTCSQLISLQSWITKKYWISLTEIALDILKLTDSTWKLSDIEDNRGRKRSICTLAL